MSQKRLLAVLLVSVLLIFGGCSSQKSNETMSSQPASAIAEAPAPAGDNQVSQSVQERKMIQKLYYTIQTKTYESTLTLILDTMEKHKGYIENMEQRGLGGNENTTGNRYGYLRIRIPAQALKTFTEEFAGDAKIVESRLETEDATAQFFDTEAHLKTLTIQEGRLLALLDQSTRLEDMIELEARLSQVRYEIENLQSTLNRLDQLVTYSVVEIALQEVKDVLKLEGKADSYFERAYEMFMTSVQAVFVFFEEASLWLIGLVPVLLIFVPVILIYKGLVHQFPSLKWIKKVKKPEQVPVKHDVFEKTTKGNRD